MEYCVKIPIQVPNQLKVQTFKWNSNGYKKLKAIFCSPKVDLSLLFNDGKEIFMRGFEYGEVKHTAPNNRVFHIDKPLKDEVIIGVVGKTEAQSAVYLIVEK